MDLSSEWVRRACDFSDVWDLAMNTPAHQGFKLSSSDEVHRITMHTKRVPDSPIHLMKASAVMPCEPRAFLRYLDMDVRSLWDEHFLEGVVLHDAMTNADMDKVPPPKYPSSRTTKTRKEKVDMEHITAGSAQVTSNGSSRDGGFGVGDDDDEKDQREMQSASGGQGSGSGGTIDGKGQVHVQGKHIAFASPIPLLLHRDFELIIAEWLRPDGVAVLKAISPPTGTLVPVRSDYVRGVVQISGFVAVPCRYYEPRLRRKVDGCRVTYVALVHPMGLIPPLVVNIVVGKQTSTLVRLQDFIATNPLERLVARGLISSATSGAKCGVVMRREHTSTRRSKL